MKKNSKSVKQSNMNSNKNSNKNNNKNKDCKSNMDFDNLNSNEE